MSFPGAPENEKLWVDFTREEVNSNELDMEYTVLGKMREAHSDREWRLVMLEEEKGRVQ